jgi:molybdopterin molybdotransferase
MTSGEQILTLMAELSRTLFTLSPPVRPQLQPAVTVDEIRSAEESLGIRFPDELFALLSCHNGQLSFLSGEYADPVIPSLRQPTGMLSYYWLAGIEEIVENTLLLRDEYAECVKDEEFEIVGPTRNHDRFVVFTVTENADWLVLDLEPESGGKVGQVVMQCTEPFELIVVADGLASFLQMLIDGYKSGRFKFQSDQPFTHYADD